MHKFFLIILFLLVTKFGLSYDFSRLDSIINSGIESKFYPGASVLLGNNEGIIYSKSFGRFTYDDSSPLVNDESIFDLASLTKAVAATTAAMKLFDEGRLDINQTVVFYLPEFSGDGKEFVRVHNLLLHNSGLVDWKPFYTTCKNKDEVLKEIYSLNLTYTTGTKFLYSDLNFILLFAIIEKITGKDFSSWCKENIFLPLGMNNTMFNPPESLKERILPTEIDNRFRNRLLQGEVHDENAFVLGGVSGHAGLFSNTKDLYRLAAMLLNSGKFEDERRTAPYKVYVDYISESTVTFFTSKIDIAEYQNTRTFGWDTKQPPIGKYRSQCGELISENCFGHTGFTGTSLWCDRDNNLIVIFLTNRVYPTRDNQGFKSIRPEVYNESIKILKSLN